MGAHSLPKLEEDRIIKQLREEERHYHLKLVAREAASLIERGLEPTLKWIQRPKRWDVSLIVLGVVLGVVIMVAIGLLTGSDGVHCTHDASGYKVCWWGLAWGR